MSQIFRLYEPGDLKLHSTFSLSGDSHHILTRVLRMKEGDQIQILNGEGRIAAATLIQVGKKDVDVTINDVVVASRPNVEIDLYIGCLKGEKLSWVVQKCCELGVSTIHFFLSEHSVAMKSLVVLEKAKKTAIEAIRQSGNPFLPLFSFHKKMEDIEVKNEPHLWNVFLHEKEEVEFKSLIKKPQPSKICLFVGPEGGFSENEKLRFVGLGCYSVRIAPYVLRAETAAVAAVSACTALIGGI